MRRGAWGSAAFLERPHDSRRSWRKRGGSRKSEALDPRRARIACIVLPLLAMGLALVPPIWAAGAAAPTELPITGPGVPQEPLPPTWVPGEVVVKFKEGALAVKIPSSWRPAASTGAAEFDASAARFGFKQVRRYFGAYRPRRPDLLMRTAS